MFDDELTGFGLRVTEKGAKVFIFQYTRGYTTGKNDKKQPLVRRMVLGRYGDITPAYARSLAEVARGEVAAGRDPVAAKAAALAAEAAERTARKAQEAADAFTLEKLVQAWAETGLRGASESHKYEAPAGIRRTFKQFLQRPAASLTVAELQKCVDAVAQAHPATARRARDYARACGNWGLGRNLVPQNPFAALRIEGRPASRERALTDPELGAVWRAALRLRYPFGPLLRLLILTLARREEVAAMRWTELDPDFSTWTLPAARAKNRKGHIVHLTEPARAELRELAKLPRKEGQTLIFSTTGTTPVSGFSRAVEQLQKVIAAEPAPKDGKPVEWHGPWVLHDLRRTGVTTLARLGVPPHVADRLLNHVQGTIRGVAAVYQRHEFMAERRAAAEKWSEHVLAVAAAGAPAGADLPANVVRMPKRRRASKVT